MLITNTQPSLIHLDKDTMLIPGVNTIELETWKKFESHPMVKILLDKGDLELEQAPSEVEANGDSGDANALEGLKFSSAKSMIKQTMSVELLNLWLTVEKKETVIDLIKKQIELITAPPTKRNRNESRQVSTGVEPEMIELKVKPEPQDD